MKYLNFGLGGKITKMMNTNFKAGKYFSTVISDINDIKILGIYPPMVWECRKLSFLYHRILKETLTHVYCRNCQEQIIEGKTRISRINEIFQFKLKYTLK